MALTRAAKGEFIMNTNKKYRSDELNALCIAVIVVTNNDNSNIMIAQGYRITIICKKYGKLLFPMK